MAATKLRIATGKIILMRKGQRIAVKAGEKFEFTQDEIDSILEVNPGALRKPINEVEDAPQAKTPAAPKGKAEAKPEDKGNGNGGNGGNGGAGDEL
jgi:hypothetical protein